MAGSTLRYKDIRRGEDRSARQKPMEVESNPPLRNAFSISSKERAEIRTPDPNAMIPAITLWGMGAIQASNAPSTKAEPLRTPHSPA